MNIYIDFAKGKIEKVTPAPIYFGDNNVDKITLYFKNIADGVEWYPTLSALCSDNNPIYPRLFDTDGTGTKTIDGVVYTYYEFTLSNSNGWNLTPGRILFYVWVNYPNTNGNKCVGTFGCTILNTSGYYQIDNPVVNPELREYLETSFQQQYNEIDEKFNSLEEEFNDEYTEEVNAQRDLINNFIGGEPRYVNTSSNILALTSNKGVAVATDNGHWYYWDGEQYVDSGIPYQATQIAEDSVSTIDTKFYEKNSLNLLDKTTITRGHFIYTDGSIRENAGYFYTDYIEVLPIEPYFMSPSLTNNNFYAFYDSDKNFISGGYTGNDYLTTPATAKYIRISMQLSILDIAYVSKFSTIKSGYIIDNNNIDNNATNLKISKGKYNLFDKNKICKGWYKYYLSGETTALASYCISDFIEITPNTTIYIKIPNQQMHISYFDENYSYVSGNLILNGEGNFVTPSTAKYVILSFKWQYADIVMLSYSNINYLPHYTLDEADKLVSSPIREKVIIKPNGVFNDIVDGFNYAFLAGNCDVYIDGVWELNDYLNKVTPNAGIRIGNNNHYFFASGSKITFTYPGSDTSISNVVSAFISQRGFGDFEMYNATIECNNVRYCVHDDNGGVSSSNLPLISYTHKYINCNMKLTRPNTPANTHCIGAGIGEDGYVVIDGCLFNSVNSQNGDVSFHGNWNFNSYSIAGKFNMFITNCYFEHTLQLVSPDPESTPKNLLFTNNSISENIIFNDTDTTKWNVKQWNNEIRS